jgi:hypothetical protein
MSSTVRTSARAPACRWLCAALLSLASLAGFEASSADHRQLSEDPVPGSRDVGDCDLGERKVRDQRSPGARGRGYITVEIMVQLLKTRVISARF